MTFAPRLVGTTRIAGRGTRSHSASRSCERSRSSLRTLAHFRMSARNRLCATSCFVGKPLALEATQRDLGTLNVVEAEFDPVGVAEIEFVAVPMQVLVAHDLIDAHQSALED